MPKKSRVPRRKFIQSTVAASAIGVTGCLGGGQNETQNEDEPTETTTDDTVNQETESNSIDTSGTGTWNLGTPGEGLQSNIAGKAFARALDNNDSRLSLQVKAFSGSEESIRLVGRGDINMAASPNYLAAAAHNSSNPISGVDFKADRAIEQEILQSLSYMDLRLYFVSLDESIQTMEDLRGKEVNVGPPGAAWLSVATFDNIGILEDVEVTNTGFKDVPFSLTEGRVDATLATASLGVTAPPYIENLRNEDITVIEYTDEHLSKLEEASGFRVDDVQVNKFFDKDVGIDSMSAATQGYQFMINENASKSLAYEFAKQSIENKTEIQEFAGFLQNFDGEYGVSGLVEDIPVHPGVAAYLKENDLWSGNLTTPE